MDRQTAYAGQILPETTLLQMAKDSMIGVAKLSAAVLGTSTMANGFAVTPTGPASLQVVAAPGEIYSLTTIDATQWSSLAADTTHSIMKQGILLDAVTLTCAAPTTTGQSINYLVQATYQDVDANPVLLPYYNSANPSQPFSGQGNNGLTQNTVRKGAAVVAVKAGVSAATGSQTTPAPDAGYVGLYVVTVAYGQTTITSTSISQYSSAPLLPSGLLQSIQSGNTAFAVDTGTANAYVCNFTPALTVRNESTPLRFKVKTTSTGACTFNDGISTVALVGGAHAALQGGELVANGDAWIQWNASVGGGSYILLFCTGAPEQVALATQSQHAVNAGQIQTQAVTAFTTAGTAPAFTLTPAPAITAYAANQRFRVKFSAASAGSDTLNVNGVGPKNLKQYDSGGNKIAVVLAAGQIADVEYDGTDMVVLDPLPTTSSATQAQFDNSTKIATTAFVQRFGVQFSGVSAQSASTTLTTSSAGSLVIGNSASAINVTLPAASSMPSGSTIKFWNYAAGTMTIVCAGSDNILLPAGVATYAVPQGVWITLVSNASTGWSTVDLAGVGVGQTWQNVAGSRAGATTYTNSTGRPLSVLMGMTAQINTNLIFIVNGISIPVNNSGGTTATSGSISAVIPPGGTYSCNAMPSIWLELR